MVYRTTSDLFIHGMVIMAGTTRCPDACDYCYLDENARWHNPKDMEPHIADSVAHYLEDNYPDNEVVILWHGSEPFAVKRKHFERLVYPFEALRVCQHIHHSVQSNATLITSEWCDFLRHYEFRIGVSLDGPVWANTHRKNRGGRPMFPKTMKGIECLEKHDLGYGVICVVTQETLGKARELYEFFCGLPGVRKLGINIESTCGIYRGGVRDDAAVEAFWHDLVEAWIANPRIRDVREIRQALQWIARSRQIDNEPKRRRDLVPVVAHDGKVILLSPELSGSRSEKYNDFVAGDLMVEPMKAIYDRAPGLAYVQDFLEGIERCWHKCESYGVCWGGHASNKFSELGTTGGIETAYCRHNKQAPLEAVLSVLESMEGKGGEILECYR